MHHSSSVPRHLLDDVCAHLGQGRLDEASQERLHRLASRIPDAMRPEGGRLWRAITLEADDFDQLKSGGSLHLDKRDFECWSRSEDAILHILRTRSMQAHDMSMQDGKDRVAVILARNFASEDCLLDLHAFFRSLDGLEVEIPGWNNYAKHEQEVIVRLPSGITEIRPEFVQSSWRVTDPEIYEPRLGETFQDVDEELVIEELLGVNDCGCYEVRSGDHIYPLVHEFTYFTTGGPIRPVETPDNYEPSF